MNENLKKLSEETKAAIAASIATNAVADLFAKTKSSSDSDAGSFKVVVSTSDVDRQGESVDQKGWDLTFFKTNPVVLWAHDYSSLPIGMCTSIEVRDDKLIAEGKFAPAEANPLAQQIRKLYDLGMVNTTSVGFIPKEYDGAKSGVISKSELLEFSFVPVPANPHALRLDQIKKLGIDTVLLRTKGIEIKEEATVEPGAIPATAVEPVSTVEPVVTPSAATEPATPPDDNKKGAVGDELDAIETSQMKWQNIHEVYEAIDAFCAVYFDESTPVDSFKTLLTETIGILQQIAENPNDGDMDNKIAKLRGNSKPIRLIINSFASGSEKLSAGEKIGKENAAELQRSNTVGGLNKELSKFVETRDLLRISATAMSQALENFNKSARTS